MGLIRFAGKLLKAASGLAIGADCCCCCAFCFDEVTSTDPEPYICLLASDVDFICSGDVEECEPIVEPDCETLPFDTLTVGSCSVEWRFESNCTACADRVLSLLKFCDESKTPKFRLRYIVNCSAECDKNGIATVNVVYDETRTLVQQNGSCVLPTFNGRITWNPLP